MSVAVGLSALFWSLTTFFTTFLLCAIVSSVSIENGWNALASQHNNRTEGFRIDRAESAAPPVAVLGKFYYLLLVARYKFISLFGGERPSQRQSDLEWGTGYAEFSTIMSRPLTRAECCVGARMTQDIIRYKLEEGKGTTLQFDTHKTYQTYGILLTSLPAWCVSRLLI